MKWIGLAVLLLSGGCATSLPPSGQGSPAILDGIPLVSYCDLMASPEVYFNKEVRLRAVFRYGFEWQQVYSTRCLDAPNTWVEFASDQGCPHTIEHRGPVRGGGSGSEVSGETLGVVFRGRLTGWGSGYGHLGAFASEFQVTCMEETTLLDLESYYPTALTPAMKKRIETFEGKPVEPEIGKGRGDASQRVSGKPV
jgi:hypothetical protein